MSRTRGPATRHSAHEAFADAVRTQYASAGPVLIPPSWEWQSFRLRAERAVYVDVKNHPYAPREVLEWQNRTQRARRFQEVAPGDRLRMCGELGVDSYAIAARRVREPEETIVAARGYALVRCPG